jgi:hypothetical protein
VHGARKTPSRLQRRGIRPDFGRVFDEVKILTDIPIVVVGVECPSLSPFTTRRGDECRSIQ